MFGNIEKKQVLLDVLLEETDEDDNVSITTYRNKKGVNYLAKLGFFILSQLHGTVLVRVGRILHSSSLLLKSLKPKLLQILAKIIL